MPAKIWYEYNLTNEDRGDLSDIDLFYNRILPLISNHLTVNEVEQAKHIFTRYIETCECDLCPECDNLYF